MAPAELFMRKTKAKGHSNNKNRPVKQVSQSVERREGVGCLMVGWDREVI